MKECHGCGANNPNDAKYCNVCGTRLKATGVSRVWLWLLGAVSLSLAGLWLGTWLQLRQTRDNLQARDNLTQTVSRSYDARLDSMQQAFYRLDAELCSAERRLNDFQLMVGRAYPLIIDSIEIGNVTRNQDVISAYGSPIYSDETQYLQPRIYYRGILQGNVDLMVKWYDSDGELRVGQDSPAGFSQKTECYIYEETKVLRLKGWGNTNSGNWRRGNYRLEIWCHGMLLGSKRFSVL